MSKNLAKSSALLFAVFVIMFTAGNVMAVNPLQAPEDELVIEGKKPARFAHKVHLTLGLDCGVCHHDREHKPLNKEAIASLEDPSGLHCVSCHNSSFAVGELQQAKDVFHARCKTCHQEGYAGKNGPTKCSDCHIKSAKKALEGC